MNQTCRQHLQSCVCAFLFWAAMTKACAGELNLALANSTCDAMQRVGEAYQATREVKISYNCKSSGLLAKGLRGGAIGADIFVSADLEWMEFAIDNGLVARKQVFSPWGNALVVAVPADSPLRIRELRDLATDRITTILIGDPSTAPFGRHAKEVLEADGLWERVKDKVETRKNITLLAEALATSGETTVGILFGSNLNAQLRQVLAIRKNLHKPIRYYLAPLKSAAENPEAARFLKFLQGSAARAIFQAEGFDVTPQ